MSRLPIAFLILAVAASGCSLFSTREPEDPITDSGSFVQPDTPEQVVENVRAAVGELNTLNYRRSLAEEFVFRATAAALARESVFEAWSRAQEEQYFSTMAAAAELGSGHSLTLNDQSFTVLTEDRFVLDATYVLRVSHQRTEIPTEVQGRLQWVIAQGTDGLWAISEWTDQELGTFPSWSDLKAEFTK